MPLHDHFHPPLSQECPWESFHSTWATAIVGQLNGGLLPAHFRALPQLHMGTHVAVDVATFSRDRAGEGQPDENGSSGNGVATAVWAPPQPSLSTLVDFTDRDTFEVAVLDSLQRRLVAAIELVSPANKDRPASRRDFAIKCASYLQQHVSLIVVDVVTSRRDSLHYALATLLDLPEAVGQALTASLYAAVYRLRLDDDGQRQLDFWPMPLRLENNLPAAPLWLAEDLAIPLDLQESYDVASSQLRLFEV